MDNNPTLGFLIHDVARLLRKRFEQNARHIGLTRTQWQTLAYLSRNEGVNQKALAEMLEIEPITLKRVIDNLENRGFVERRADQNDRRVWLLFMTSQSHSFLDEMRSLGEQTRSEALAGIDENERTRLARILETMKLNLIEGCRPSAGNGNRNV